MLLVVLNFCQLLDICTFDCWMLNEMEVFISCNFVLKFLLKLSLRACGNCLLYQNVKRLLSSNKVCLFSSSHLHSFKSLIFECGEALLW